VFFDGLTERLIPLFAIGAFLTFTLSQAGMVLHWRRERRGKGSPRHDWRLWVNALGTLTTGVAFLIILCAKFSQGAWITLLVIPCGIVLLLSVHRYYSGLSMQVREEVPLVLEAVRPPTVVVVIEEWSRLTDKAMHFAMRLSPDVSRCT
jgi:amino acid transporter